jgi:hypothetical protein
MSRAARASRASEGVCARALNFSILYTYGPRTQFNSLRTFKVFRFKFFKRTHDKQNIVFRVAACAFFCAACRAHSGGEAAALIAAANKYSSSHNTIG